MLSKFDQTWADWLVKTKDLYFQLMPDPDRNVIHHPFRDNVGSNVDPKLHEYLQKFKYLLYSMICASSLDRPNRASGQWTTDFDTPIMISVSRLSLESKKTLLSYHHFYIKSHIVRNSFLNLVGLPSLSHLDLSKGFTRQDSLWTNYKDLTNSICKSRWSSGLHPAGLYARAPLR